MRRAARWLVGQRGADGKASFELAAQVEFESSLFQSDEAQRAVLLKMLSETVTTKQPHVLPPTHQQPQPEAAQLSTFQQAPPPQPQSPNRTPYPFLHVPLHLKDQVLGVLQVWMQPYVQPANYQEFATFINSLAMHVEQHLQGAAWESRRRGQPPPARPRSPTTSPARSIPLEVARLGATTPRSHRLRTLLDPALAATAGSCSPSPGRRWWKRRAPW